MRRDRRLLATVVVCALGGTLLVCLWLLALAFLLGSVVGPALRGQVQEVLAPHLPLLGLGVLLLALGIGALTRTLYLRWVLASARLAEQAQALLMPTGTAAPLSVSGPLELRALADMMNRLAAQRDALEQDVQARAAQASQSVEQERNRLAALMGELDQSVVVCNLDGRILLYNQHARLQFRALSAVPTLADGAELIGLGRSIYSVFDRRLVAHALGSVRKRLQRGAVNPSARFVTLTRSGQLLRVSMSPVREVVVLPEAPEGRAQDGHTLAGGSEAHALPGQHAADPTGAHLAHEPRTPALAGFVLVLENVTAQFEREAERDRLALELADEATAALAGLSALVSGLPEASSSVQDDQNVVPPHTQLVLQWRAEAEAAQRRLRTLSAGLAQRAAQHWPLEEVPGIEFLDGARSHLEAQADLRCTLDEVDPGLWLRIDGFAVLEAMTALALRLRDEHGVRLLALRLTAESPERACLDLVWSGGAMSTETAMTWELDPMPVAAGASSVREVVQRHGGAFRFQRDRARQRAFFRFELPRAQAAAQMEAQAFLRGDSRPEFYDFDLFRSSPATRALEERRLRELAFTVFDTETTGLEPSAGDEIIQIGAVRVLNGRLRRAEAFEQLIDPRRPIPRASIPIHGIEPQMVRGQPTIEQVLPAFHAYAQDTVLVAHNAAFDMRFLELKEAAAGVCFDQPVLDTLLLSAVVHPMQASHRLEAIAERFGIAVIGRHTALGDAIVTAEVLLRLIPLLEAKGIQTLAQAREAAQQTYYARLTY